MIEDLKQIYGESLRAHLILNLSTGQHGQNKKGKPTDYGIQLQAKQKLKAYYGNINERQFRNIYRSFIKRRYRKPNRIESRLDTVIYRAKFAQQFAARQMINGHIKVNKKRLTFQVMSLKVQI